MNRRDDAVMAPGQAAAEVDRPREPVGKDHRALLESHLAEAKRTEIPPADICLKIARCYLALGESQGAVAWLGRAADAGDEFQHWQSAAMLLRKLRKSVPDLTAKRSANVWLCGSYTTLQLAELLPVAALRQGVLLDLQQSGYGQYRQDIIDPHSALYKADPELVVIALHSGELAFPEFSREPEKEVERELARWTSLWQALAARSKARIVMFNFASPYDNAFGHLASRLSGARTSMIQALNARLGEAAAAAGVAIVDCERLSSLIGKRTWFSDRYWHMSKQGVALEALPFLSRHVAAVIAAELGLSKKCLVLDLDNTLWGGVIGEDGLSGIKIGQGSPHGEAFTDFQRQIKTLQAKGVILAVCSKNNEADAREVFAKHPDMLLRIEDFAVFVANWETKPENLRRIARTLNIGLDSLVFVDDNPAEREIVRQHLPEVDVLPLPPDPSGYARALSDYLMFETAAFTAEDAAKTEQYRAKALVAELEAGATSIEDFYRSLAMQAITQPFDEMHLSRIVQLLGKTNQFNLTTRRYSEQDIRAIMADPDCVHWYLKLRDKFADHGLVSIIIGKRDGDVMEIDIWLMSCRVIGRTVEQELLARLCESALAKGCTRLRGVYVPTAKNAMVKTVYERFGFELVETRDDGTSVWSYDLRVKGPITNAFIERVGDPAPEAA